jgi:hypothetical protein
MSQTVPEVTTTGIDNRNQPPFNGDPKAASLLAAASVQPLMRAGTFGRVPLRRTTLASAAAVLASPAPLTGQHQGCQNSSASLPTGQQRMRRSCAS